ncbi:MAG TPA: MarR family transcriptional regulator [Dermatophilaceae bacterium]|nr:MarR family transcriptional regulator [Dermatophilaceae bacterium]
MSTHIAPQWLDAEEQHAWREYLHATRVLEAVLDRDLQAEGLQLSEYEIIAMLSEQPDRRLRMSEIAALVVQSRSRLTHTAGRLEKRGWVRREACVGDRRGVELVLTDVGYSEIIRMAPTHVNSVRRNFVSHLSREDLLALGRAMEAINAGIRSTGVCDEVLVVEGQPA